MSRLERNRALFEASPRTRLVETLTKASPELLAGVIVKALEMQIVSEDFALSKGVDFDDEEVGKFARENRAEIATQLDRAITGFIGSIVSQEG